MGGGGWIVSKRCWGEGVEKWRLASIHPRVVVPSLMNLPYWSPYHGNDVRGCRRPYSCSCPVFSSNTISGPVLLCYIMRKDSKDHTVVCSVKIDCGNACFRTHSASQIRVWSHCSFCDFLCVLRDEARITHTPNFCTINHRYSVVNGSCKSKAGSSGPLRGVRYISQRRDLVTCSLSMSTVVLDPSCMNPVVRVERGWGRPSPFVNEKRFLFVSDAHPPVSKQHYRAGAGERGTQEEDLRPGSCSMLLICILVIFIFLILK